MGYSYADEGEVNNSPAAAEDVFAFLQLFIMNASRSYVCAVQQLTGSSSNTLSLISTSPESLTPVSLHSDMSFCQADGRHVHPQYRGRDLQAQRCARAGASPRAPRSQLQVGLDWVSLANFADLLALMAETV